MNTPQAGAPGHEASQTTSTAPASTAPPPASQRQSLLGAFLRTHRERLNPADVGLPPGRRRRTPGLRREELAQLAGLSTTWITWLEQGRSISLSARALDSLARALQLTRAERSYLFELADRRDPTTAPQSDMPPALLASVHAIQHPAYLLDRLWNALAWNQAATELFVGWLDAASPERNLLRAMFLSPRLQQLVDDWPHRAARLAAEFRAHSIRHADDGPTRELVDTLLAQSPSFKADWQSQDVEERQGGRRGFHHPARGLLSFEQVTFVPVAASSLMLVMLLPTASSV